MYNMIPDLLNIILDYAGEYQLLSWINPEKINWYCLSANNHEWAISQLKLHPEKINWWLVIVK